MQQQLEKIRLIYKPFLIIAISVIGGYTFLNWLLILNLHAFSINEELINLWFPMLLPWIPILIWLRPRIKLLNLKRKKGDLLGLYIAIAGFAIAAPTVLAQNYIEKATGKLTHLVSISQINKLETRKYYTFKKFYIDKRHIGVQSKFEVSGKHSEDLNMSLFVVLPVLSSPADTLNFNCLAWYGVKYKEQISNRLDESEKNKEFQRFLRNSQYEFDRMNVNSFIYLDRIGNNDDHKGYNQAIKNNKRFSTNSTIVLIPMQESFDKRTGNTFGWIFGSFAIGACIWLIMILIPKFETEMLQKYETENLEDNTEINEYISFFIPKDDYFITPIIMNLNILVFILMVFSGLGFISFNGIDLLSWGANFRPMSSNGEWWRLVTSTFLHGGIMHLVANMSGLVFVGIILEPRLGRTYFAIIYIITGVLSSVASLMWHDATVSVGASGAIFGLYGVFLALLLTKVFPKEFNRAFLTSTIFFIGFNLLMGLSGGIDNAAHIGGLISGLLIGFVIYPQLKQDTI
jgi:rhomboid protease GluP